MPITKREDAKEGGFAQLRAALQKFAGTVTEAAFDMWGGEMVDPVTGKRRPPKEFLEIVFTDVEVLVTTEELTMDISELWTIRENCSDFKGSFWIDMFLASADKFKILIPDGLKGKRLIMEKQTLEADDPKYNSTNYVIVGVEEPRKATPSEQPTATPTPASADPSVAMELVEKLAIGKTEEELKAAIPVALGGHPMLPLAQAGIITQGLINEKKIALVDGKYQKPS